MLLKELCVYPPSPFVKPANRLEPGNHIWQFSFELDAPIMESIHGLTHASLRYLVEAEVVVRGFLSPTLRTSQSLHVLNFVDTSIQDSQSLEQQVKAWVGSNGVECTVYAPPICHHWGEPIDLNFRITRPVNIKLRAVRLELRERIKLQAVFDKRLVLNSTESAIARGQKEFSDDSDQFQMRFPLPRSFKVCRQSVDQKRIEITHKLRIGLQFEDEDGTLEQVRPRN